MLCTKGDILCIPFVTEHAIMELPLLLNISWTVLLTSGIILMILV